MSDPKCICGRELAYDGKEHYCPECDDKDLEPTNGDFIDDDTWDDYE